MPTVQLKVSDSGSWNAVARRLIALMVFPQDTESQFRYIALQHARVATSTAEAAGEALVTIPLEIVSSLLETPKSTEIDDIVLLETHKGSAAGVILLTVISCALNYPEHASVSKAVEVTHRALEETATGSDDASKSPAFLRQQWSSFKPVAHFWAAFRLMARSVDGDVAELLRHLTGPGARHFLSLAEGIRAKAASIVPRGRTAPVLPPDETWTPTPKFMAEHDIEAYRLSGMELPDSALKHLDEYRAPKKI